jgi:hypothetical protein
VGLRHALNREVRPLGWIVQREQTRPAMVSRADLVMSEMGSGMVFAIIESKMIYASDALDIADRVKGRLLSDAAKLQTVRSAGHSTPLFLLTWVGFPTSRSCVASSAT